MRRPTSARSGPAVLAGLLLLAALLLVGLPAQAQAIKVTSAVPDAADQGTVGLVVAIAGDNFTSGAKVSFYVSGTKNPGGIAVKDVRFKDPKNLEATIDVAPDAQTELKFDIEVRCNSRTGKGTELFKVNVKVTGNDTIPPGSVLDLSASTDSLNIATFRWTVPADDGYDASSGPAATCIFAVRAGNGSRTPGCGPFSEEVLGSAYDPGLDPCYVTGRPSDLKCSGSGAGATCTGTRALAPDTEYWAVVRYCDDATPTANCSPLAEDLAHQIRLVTGPAPQTSWSVSVADGCPFLSHDTCSLSGYYSGKAVPDVDLSNNPAVLYEKSRAGMLASWTGNAWLVEAVGPDISSGSHDFAFDPSGFATIALGGRAGTKSDLRYFRRTGATSAAWETEIVAARLTSVGVWSLAFNPLDGSPAILYVHEPKQSQHRVRLAERRGSTWTNQDVPVPFVAGFWKLAFDAAGNPAFVYVREDDGIRDLAFAHRVNGAWMLESVAGPATPGGSWNRVPASTLAFDPVRGDFSAACVLSGSGAQETFCERNAGTWTCEGLDRGEEGGVAGSSLTIRGDGTVFVAYTLGGANVAAVRSPGGTWQREYIDWNGGDVYTRIEIGSDGRPVVGWAAEHDATGAGLTATVYLARRQ